MMKWVVLALLVVGALGQEEEEELLCDPAVCLPPNCRCSSTDIPGGLSAREIPQFVTVTFDDAVTVTNIPTYRTLLNSRRNPNNCRIGATFYVSHEWTDYSLVNELYNQGYQIALHSITHRSPSESWASMTYADIVQEFVDQRTQLSTLANIPESAIQGVRLPFLQLNGNPSYQVIRDYNLGYDSSWPTISYTNPGLWPYTLDYPSSQDCPTPPCPDASVPGSWVMPMVAWTDLAGFPCAMVDACPTLPITDEEEGASADEWFQFFLTNFERHYLSNRSPFPFFIHEGYVRAFPVVWEATVRFLDLMNNIPDVFVVNHSEVLDWVRNPVTITEYRQQPCRTWASRTCTARNCGPMVSEHNGGTYYPTFCNACPRVYPWLGNPLGE